MQRSRARWERVKKEREAKQSNHRANTKVNPPNRDRPTPRPFHSHNTSCYAFHVLCFVSVQCLHDVVEVHVHGRRFGRHVFHCRLAPLHHLLRRITKRHRRLPVLSLWRADVAHDLLHHAVDVVLLPRRHRLVVLDLTDCRGVGHRLELGLGEHIRRPPRMLNFVPDETRWGGVGEGDCERENMRWREWGGGGAGTHSAGNTFLKQINDAEYCVRPPTRQCRKRHKCLL